MGLNRKFSTSIVLFLVVFMSISLFSITSVVYLFESRNTRKENLDHFENRKQEIAAIIKDNVDRNIQIAAEAASDPLFLEIFRSGDREALARHIASPNFPAYRMHPIIYDNRTGQFTPDLQTAYDGIEAYLTPQTQTEPDSVKFHRLGKNTITFFSAPIMDASEEIGTCFTAYDFFDDSRFWELLKSIGIVGAHIIFHDGNGGLSDVKTGNDIIYHSEIDVQSIRENRGTLAADLLPDEVLFSLDYFPGLYLAASLKPIQEENRAFLKVLIILGAALLCLVCIAAALLSKMATRPLEVMAAEALEIAQAPRDSFLKKERAGYVEFRNFASAFNQVLANLMELQQEVEQRAKRKLDASEERHRMTLEAAPDGITLNSLMDGRYIQVNEAFVKISGYSRNEIIGKSNEELNFFEDPDDFRRIVEEVTQKGGVNAAPVKQRRKDGAVIYSEVSARTVAFENEACLICVMSDRTAQKKAEDALQRAMKMEAIGTMAGGVAHDLNNILSGIVNYPELLLMDLPEDSPLRPAISNIQKSGQRAAAVVQDMLTLARRGVTVKELVNINTIVREYLKTPEHELMMSENPGVDMQADLAPDVMNLIGSDVHITKSLMNLVSNAIEAMPAGGDLRISTCNQYVDVPIKKYDTVNEGDYVVLEVSDTGTGISLQDQDRIFEPFYTKKKMGRSGTGLGMAVVWGTVKDHSGYIDLKSRQGVGTTFKLYFPAIRDALAADKPQIPISQYRGKGESVLVVDDVAEQRHIALDILKRLGYRTAAVSSGEEALDYLARNKVDLLVLDMAMEPGMDGLETYRKVLERFPETKAIIASGFAETDRVREAQRLGAGAYVRKPYLMQNIGIAAREALG